MIMIYTRFSADSRSSLTKNLAQPSPLLATCTFAIRTSRNLIEVLGNTKIGTYSHQLWQAGFTQSEFELHALSEVPGKPKMVLSHIKKIMAKRVVIEKSDPAWAGLIGISQPFQLTL